MKKYHLHLPVLALIMCCAAATQASPGKKIAAEKNAESTNKSNEKDQEKEKISNAAYVYYAFPINASILTSTTLNCTIAAAAENGSVIDCVNKAKIDAEKIFQDLITACTKANNPSAVDALIEYYAAWTKTMDFLASNYSGRPGTSPYERHLSELKSETDSKELKVKFKIPSPKQ